MASRTSSRIPSRTGSSQHDPNLTPAPRSAVAAEQSTLLPTSTRRIPLPALRSTQHQGTAATPSIVSRPPPAPVQHTKYGYSSEEAPGQWLAQKRKTTTATTTRTTATATPPARPTLLAEVSQQAAAPDVAATAHPDRRSSKILRRKPSVIGNYIASRRQKEPVPAPTRRLEDSHSNVAGLGVSSYQQPYSDDVQMLSSEERTPSTLAPSHSYDARPFQTPTPLSNPSVTPSLAWTDSPGGFSHTTTPSSYTSHSPHIMSSPQSTPEHWSEQVKLRSPFDDGAKARPYMETRSSEHAPAHGARKDSHATTTPKVGSRPQLTSAAGGRVRSAEKKIPHPPELAHLMDTPASKPKPSSEAPARPTRDGTVGLGDRRRISTVIHSNLPKLDTSQSKRQSASSLVSKQENKAQPAQQHQQGRRLSKQSSLSSKQASSSPNVPPHGSSLTLATKSPLSQDQSGEAVATSAGATSSKSTHRFGFFSRRAQVDASPIYDDVNKHARKGPIAGTGHEGYGRKVPRARSSSTNSAGTRSSSDKKHRTSASSKQDLDLDDFLQQRLSPVYLRGDGNQSEDQGRGSHSTVDEDAVNGFVFSSPRTGASSQSSIDLQLRPPFSKTSDSSDTMTSSRTMLAAPLDFLQRESYASSSQQSNDSAPIVRPVTAGPTIGAGGSSTTSIEQVSERSMSSDIARPRSASGESSQDVKSKKSKWSLFQKPAKGRSASKWHPFQSQASSSVEEQPDFQAIEPVPQVPASSTRQFAHYAFFDSVERLGFEDLQNIMEEADREYLNMTRPRPRKQSPAVFDSTGIAESLAEQTVDAMLLPDTTSINEERTRNSIGPSLEDPTRMTASTSQDSLIGPPRPTRLLQVGRIPRVVSKRDRERQLSDHSFSRPFGGAHYRSNNRAAVTANAGLESSIKQEATNNTRISRNAAASGLQLSRMASVDSSGARRSGYGHHRTSTSSGSQFLAFAPRKDSDVSCSSSSNTSYFPRGATSADPLAIAPSTHVDEIWNEYDDLIKDVVTPDEVRPKAQVSTPLTNKRLGDAHARIAAKSFIGAALDSSKFEPQLPSPQFPSDAVTTQRNSIPGLTLLKLREQLLSLPSPSTSTAMSGRLSQDIGLRRSTSKSDAASLHTQRSSLLSHTSSKHRRSISVPESVLASKRSSHDTMAREHAKQVDPQSMANLRFGALMTSKWLSFGRVLFSPAHYELENATVDDRILVIDGLGKDWSYYCALTYSNASVYSLGPSASKSSNRNSISKGFESLPNHRHFSHPGLGSDLPFPKSFFSVVVFRFPVATSDAALVTAISECKRVLRPGGYIEISTLDLDLANMGNRARRAVRELKMRIQGTDSETSLKSASDNVQYLLGRRGFEKLNRCIVGVPAAGVISDSRGSSRDEQDISITELMKDQSKEGDEHITKMVARVGRWWYYRCYESHLDGMGDASKSIWNDKTLLRECENLSTTFKLLVCYAQKPLVAKRRAVSL